MKTARLNLLEAMNFALAGHPVTPYNKEAVEQLTFENGKFYILLTPSLEHPKRTKRLLQPNDWNMLLELQWYAGDDKTLKGYF